MKNPADFLNGLFRAALDAADAARAVAANLPEPPVNGGRTIVVGAGKASSAMARGLESAWGGELSGLVVTRYGYGIATERIETVEAAHPVPDPAGEDAARRMLERVRGLTADDLVISLISGGGSALLSLPAPCLSAEEKREITRALLKSGATIAEMNAVRKHLSAIKGGRLALAAHPARVVTLVVSDVPGDVPHVVASGPTLPDPSSQGVARIVLEKYGIKVPDAVRKYLSDPANETPKPGDPRLANNEAHIVLKAAHSLAAAADYAKKAGIEPVILGDDIEGEAREVGAAHMRDALSRPGPCVLISGGETTVTVRGRGRGGRNTEYLLAALMAAKADPRVCGIACDTDGIDGAVDNAGALFTSATIKKAYEKGMDPAAYLAENDAFGFFRSVDGLVMTGPTFTNVNDFRALLVLPKDAAAA